MEIEFLGTGAGVPAKSRNVTSVALKLLDEINEIWLFDVGEGTQHQILRTTLKPRKISKIFISHLHGDHIFGLPGLLSSRSFQGGNQALDIYGPDGIEDFVKTSLKVSETHLAYQINYHELKPGLIFKSNRFEVITDILEHRINSYGFRIVENPYPGELNVKKLQSLKIPSGPIYGKIKSGKTVELPDGTTLNPKEFVGPDVPGRIVTIFGDTRQNERELALAQDANLIIHECTFGAEDAKMARSYYHSTNQEAASLAKKANAKKLALTHISARYLGKSVVHLQKQAQKIFKDSVVVNDFDIIDVPLVKPGADK